MIFLKIKNFININMNRKKRSVIGIISFIHSMNDYINLLKNSKDI